MLGTVLASLVTYGVIAVAVGLFLVQMLTPRRHRTR